ncbi:MAG: DNA-processing protein DprA [Bifidobacteriaceae bacterium]|jgi:DNA processing protein|nr:DNA-processing protein DprA [Bifidobacteriaceae bacterium]
MNRPVFDISDPQLALAAWSRIAEPADPDASVLVRQVGAVAALEWLVGEVGSAAAQRALAQRAAGRRPAAGTEAALARWLPRLEGLDPRRELRVLARLGGVLMHPGSPGWPAGLEDLNEVAPFALWVLAPDGVPATLGRRLAGAVAVVGARAATAYGESVTAAIAGPLAQAGHAIVSGGAYGIDAAAHRAALAVGGFTVAVMAGGLDRLYPPGNEALLRAVAAEGAVVSEVPPGSAPRRERFLDRNRLIAALAQVTVVTESGWRSGSHRTAAVAAELLRPVGAVPGPVTAASSAGCHRLIREGAATLVSDARDVMELARPAGQAPAALPGLDETSGVLDGLGVVERRVLDALPMRRPASVAAVTTACGLAPAQVLAALTRLERAGRAASSNGAWRRLSTSQS